MENNEHPTWLVPIDIAKELKEIGFNEYCPFFVYPNDDEVFISGTVTVEEDWLDEDNYGEVIIDLSVTECGKFNKLNFQTIPTWEQVFEWFREKGFITNIYYKEDLISEETMFIGEICNTKADIISIIHECSAYEEAREALVKALIQTYKQEQPINENE